MEKLLDILYENMKKTLLEELSNREKKFFPNNELDVFTTLISLNKSELKYRYIIEKGGISREDLELKIVKSNFQEACSRDFIRHGIFANENVYFISTSGLFFYYKINELPVWQVFQAYDDFKLPIRNLRLKIQEKIWVTFLLLVGSNEQNPFDITKDSEREKKLTKYFNFFKLIEIEFKNRGLKMGNLISWGKGKDVDFKKFLTNNVDLPKTGLYEFKSSKYWLNIKDAKSAKLIVEFLLDEYSGHDLVIAKSLLKKSFKTLEKEILFELNEMTDGVDHKILRELGS